MIEKRPWGSYEEIFRNNNVVIKKIIVKPECRFSLQYHGYRDETWIIIDGEALITINDSKKYYKKGDNLFIKRGEKHRVFNSTSRDFTFIEVQIGDKLSEDDIIRLEDDYGRV